MGNYDYLVEVDEIDSNSWNILLEDFSDANIYQTWAYGAVRWGASNLSHLVLRRHGKALGAAQLRIARLPILPAGIAYLRWGPMCQANKNPIDPVLLAELVAQLKNEYVKRRGLTLQIIPHAFCESDRAIAFSNAFEKEGLRPEPGIGHYQTVIVNLTRTAEVMRKGLDQKWRNQLNRSEKNGLVLEVSDGQDGYREFLALYSQMRSRKQFETSVDVDEFGRIQEILPAGQKMHTFLARIDGEAIAALVVSLIGDTGIYLLGATNEKARELKAAYFLQWQAMMWLKGQGSLAYDLGGIDRASNPGGYHFKSGFGGAEVIQFAPHACKGGLLSIGVAALSAWRRRHRDAR